jgi:hypothetical protein
MLAKIIRIWRSKFALNSVVWAFVIGLSVNSQPLYAFEFMGVEVKRHVQDYIVTTDVNIRSKPKTASKRVGKLKKLERVRAVGHAKGAWVAIRKNDEDLGFVYKPTLIAVIDGALNDSIQGAVSKDGSPDCQYVISYQGKSEAEGQMFEIADYDVRWRCKVGGQETEFFTPMFMTEGSYKKSKSPIYQITVDIVDPEGDLEEVVSTTVFYDREKALIRYDGISVKRFESRPKVSEVAAKSLPGAIKMSVEMAYQAWSEPLWKVILKL